jgi:AcrR family transcriptional regulator
VYSIHNWAGQASVKSKILPGPSCDEGRKLAKNKTNKTKASTRLPGSVKVLWREKDHPNRGPKPTLSADQIARAAISIADSDGLAAVSMQRIAREVDVTTMALYRYFSSKAELIDLMIDIAGGPAPDLSAGSKRWRTKLEEWTRRCSSIYRNHPWFLQVATARWRTMGPNELAWLEAALRVLGGTGLPARQQREAFLVLIGLVRSNAEFTAATAHGPAFEHWLSVMAKLLGKHRDRYPSLIAAIDSGTFGPPSADGLEFGLKCILDGLESLVGRQERRPRPDR